MKKIVLALLLVSALLVVAVLFYGNTDFSAGSKAYTAEKNPQTRFVTSGVGSSMEPTIKDGQGIIIDMATEPRVGDIVAFGCIDACYYEGYYQKEQGFMKRLIKIREDGAWWVEGDNKENSWDSNDYGWILPHQRTNVGVVVEVLK